MEEKEIIQKYIDLLIKRLGEKKYYLCREMCEVLGRYKEISEQKEDMLKKLEKIIQQAE